MLIYCSVPVLAPCPCDISTFTLLQLLPKSMKLKFKFTLSNRTIYRKKKN